MGIQKQKSRQRLQDFLLSFFDDELKYEEKEVNGFILTKNINGSTGEPYVCIFTKETFKKRNGVPLYAGQRAAKPGQTLF